MIRSPRSLEVRTPPPPRKRPTLSRRLERRKTRRQKLTKKWSQEAPQPTTTQPRPTERLKGSLVMIPWTVRWLWSANLRSKLRKPWESPPIPSSKSRNLAGNSAKPKEKIWSPKTFSQSRPPSAPTSESSTATTLREPRENLTRSTACPRWSRETKGRLVSLKSVTWNKESKVTELSTTASYAFAVPR